MLYTIKHRCVGFPDDKPAEYVVEANSLEEADDKFSEAHVDLNYFIVSITPNTACTGQEPAGASENQVACGSCQ